MNILQVNKQNINNFKQNKIRFIIDDCKNFGYDSRIIKLILLARGINKWLANRKRIIGLKDEIKAEITQTLLELKTAKDNKQFYHIAKLKGYLKAKVEDRQRIREICHGNRWQFPD